MPPGLELDGAGSQRPRQHGPGLVCPSVQAISRSCPFRAPRHAGDGGGISPVVVPLRRFPEERASLLRRMPGIHGIRRMGGCAGRSMNGKRSGPGTEWRKTYCPRTVPWYAVNMAGMSRFLLIVLLLCGAFPLFSRAQDIASPGMPVVDLDSETGKKFRRSVPPYAVLWLYWF